MAALDKDTTASINIQAQIRRNAVEQNEVLRDLTLWEKDIKKRDEEHHLHKGLLSTTNAKAEIDASAVTSNDNSDNGLQVQEQVQEQVQVQLPEQIKGKSSMIIGSQPPASSKPVAKTPPAASTSLSDEESSKRVPTNPKEAEEKERQRGNAFYASGKYHDAIKCYSKCIQMHPRSVAAYSNRGEFLEKVCTLHYKYVWSG